MKIENVVNLDGDIFQDDYIESAREYLSRLDDNEKMIFRNNNSKYISSLPKNKVLVLSGPGTGKSYLFIDRIKYWIDNEDASSILVTSFVRKLVHDLSVDIKNKGGEYENKVVSSTLHKLARRIVEKNHGTSKWKFKKFFKMIAGDRWENMVWKDAVSLLNFSLIKYKKSDFYKMLYKNKVDNEDSWCEIEKQYYILCKLYNTSGFPDLILRASSVLKENAEILTFSHIIVDEYQDFNEAENIFINEVIKKATSVLIAGDDDQVLYESKLSKPDFIRQLYQSGQYVNCMLPFCSRSQFHIVQTASVFLQNLRKDNAVKKLYIPIRSESGSPKVKYIACAKPSTACDYIKDFINKNKEAVEKRKQEIYEGTNKDAFLLILSPIGKEKAKSYYAGIECIFEIIEEYKTECRILSEDYYKIYYYYLCGNNVEDSFTIRKLLDICDVDQSYINFLLNRMLQENKAFWELGDPKVTEIIAKAKIIAALLKMDVPVEEIVKKIIEIEPISNIPILIKNLEEIPILNNIDYDNQAKIEDIEAQKMCPVEFMTIVGSKGLSADNVIVIGFDNINMQNLNASSFYVALTRARKELHIITSMQARGASTCSEYINHLPESNAEFISYRKKGTTVLNGKKHFISWFDFIKNKRKKG